VRAVALDVHRDFCEVAIVAEGRLRSAGRIRTRPERELALQAQRAYERTVADWQANKVGAGATPGRASQRPSSGTAARQTSKPQRSAL
jgi:hypothetical protein